MNNRRRKVWLPPSDIEVLEDFNDFLLAKYKKVRNEVTYSEFSLAALLALAAWSQHGGVDSTHVFKELENLDKQKENRPLDDNAIKFNESFQYLKRTLADKVYLFRDLVFAISEFDQMIEFGVSEIMHWLSERTYQAFDYWLEEYQRAGKRLDFIQPSFITQLTLAVLGRQKDLKNLKIFNPFAGSGSFLTTLGKENEFYAQELHELTFHLLQLRLCSYGVSINRRNALDRSFNTIPYWVKEKQSSLGEYFKVNPSWNGDFKTSLSSVNLEDSLTSHVETGDFDLLVSSVPAFSGAKNTFALKAGLLNLLSVVKTGGTIALILPTSHLFSSGYKAFRKYIIDKGWLKTVITLPRVINGNPSRTSLSLLIIVKRKSNKCRFVDLTRSDELLNVEGRASVNSIIRLIYKGDHDASVNIDYSKIDKEKFILVPKRYIFFNSSLAGVPLGRHVQVITNRTIRTFEELKKEKALIIEFDKESTSAGKTHVVGSDSENAAKVFKEYQRFHQVYFGSKELIVQTKKWFNAYDLQFLDPIYEAYPKYKDLSIWVPVSFKILTPKNNTEVYLPYLKNALNHDFEEQIQYLSYTSKLNLTKLDLLSLRISLPSLQVQQELSRLPGTPFLSSVNRKEDELIEKVERLESQRFSTAFSEIASLTHSMSKDLLSIILGLDKLQNFFSGDAPLIKATIEQYNSNYKKGLVENISGMTGSLNSISKMLEDLRNRKSVADYDLDAVDCDLVLNEIIDVSESFNAKSFVKVEIEASSAIDINTLISEHAVDRKVRGINLELFKRLIINVLSNADTHAFEGVQLSITDRIVKIELEIDEQFLIMRIMNNGKPFPENFRKREFILERMSTNTNRNSGRGGYDIHEWSTYMQGEDSWDLVLNDEDQFPVIFNFKYKLA